MSIRDRVNQAVFSPDGNYLVVSLVDGEVNDNFENNIVQLYPWTLDNPSCDEINALAPIETWQRPAVADIAFSPGGEMLAIATENRIERWELDASEFLPLTLENSDNVAFTNIHFNPALPVLVSGNKDGRVEVWNPFSNSQETELTILSRCRQNTHIGDVQSLHFHPNGNVLATGGIDNTIKLWAINYEGPTQKTGICDLHTNLMGHNNAVESLSFSADGTYLISGSEDKTIRKWWLGDFLASTTAAEDIETSDTPPSELRDLLTRSCYYVNDFVANNPNDLEGYQLKCMD